MARIAEDLLLLLLDNDEAQPRLDRSRLQRVLAAALVCDLAFGCRVRPALPGEAVTAGHLVALVGPVPTDPAVRPALALLQEGPISPASAIARMWAGVVPQQPPTMLTSPAWAHSPRCRAVVSGDSL